MELLCTLLCIQLLFLVPQDSIQLRTLRASDFTDQCMVTRRYLAQAGTSSESERPPVQLRIEKDAYGHRIDRPDDTSDSGTTAAGPARAPIPRRIKRQEEPDVLDKPNQVPVSDFVPVSAKEGQTKAAFADASEMPQSTFDIGTDRNSRELVLAWEQWHKQVSGSLYYRTSRRLGPSLSSGEAAAEITVTREHNIYVKIENSSGSPVIAAAYEAAVKSLDKNPGLAFPAGSQREEVTFRYIFKVSPFVHAGYDWDKNDYETVRTPE